MKIVCLRGKASSGKSSLLKELIIHLIRKKKMQVKWMYKRTDDPIRQIQDEWFGAGYVKDLNIVLQRADKLVGVTSKGDTLPVVKDAFDLLKKHADGSLDVFVCACHPQTDVEEWLCSLAEPADIRFIDCDNLLARLSEAVMSAWEGKRK